MEIVNLVQGSTEWHAHRRNHFNASDAPAMLNCSPYTTRAELINKYATGLTQEVDAQTQAIFNKGHKFESLARPIAEGIIGEELFPCVGVDGKYSASFDGTTILEDTIFEHKTLNDDIRNCTSIDDLRLDYKVQMEHQLLVSRADTCLFLATVWDDNNQLIEQKHFWYMPDLVLRQRVIDGWAQLAKDVVNYVPEVVEVQAVGITPETLPALNIQVTGMVTASNIDQFKTHALTVIRAINKDLQTDQDFADAEQTVKWCSEVESRLASAKEHALSQTASIDELFKAIDDISAEARRVRLDLDKLVKTRKDSIKAELINNAKLIVRQHIDSLNNEIGQSYINTQAFNEDFAGVIKGKKTIESIKNAIDSEIARIKIDANSIAGIVRTNISFLKENAQDYRFLFSDLAQIVNKPTDDFTNLAKMRIAQHKEDETKRLALEREKIRLEEQHKAERMAQQEIERQKQIEQAKVQEVKPMLEPESLPEIAPDPIQAINDKPIVREPTLTIGVINSRLGFAVSGDFLTQLGFEPVQVGAFKKYQESDFSEICKEIINHIANVRDTNYTLNTTDKNCA